MRADSFIKINRSIIDWEWYKDSNTKALFLHCVLKANWKDGKFEGVDVPRGSFVSSYRTLAEECGLTLQSVRTAIKHLKSTQCLTSKTYPKFTVFTVKKYTLYQDSNTITNKQLTHEQHTSNTRATQIEEKKEIKNNNNNIYTQAFAEFWETYPRKKDKGYANKKFKARLNEGYTETELIEAAKNYADECKRNHTEQKYIKYAGTFLSDSLPFLDYLDKNYKGGETDGYFGETEKGAYRTEYERLFETL